MAYHRQQGVDTCIVRIFNTYGTRMRPNDGRAIPTFIRQAQANEPLTVFGDGSQTRSFCYVDDLIRGLVLLAESGEHLPVNIGNPQELTLLELAETVIRVTGVEERDRLRGAARRRSAGAPARHHPRPAAAGLGAAGRPRGGPAACPGIHPTGVAQCLSASPQASSSSSLQPWRPLPPPRPQTSTPTRSPVTCIVGINDEADTLYGNPVVGFQALKALKAQVLRVNLYWGGNQWAVSRGARPTDPTDPGDPAYNWALYDRLVRYAADLPHPGLVLDPVHARRGRTAARGRTSRRRIRRTSQDFAYAAAQRYSGFYVPPSWQQQPALASADVAAARRDHVDGVERAEQPGLPHAAVRRASGGKWVIESAVRLREDLQRGLQRHPLRPDRRGPDRSGRAGRVRRHRRRRATTRLERRARRSTRSRSSPRRSGSG